MRLGHISVKDSYLSIWRGFYFHESFAKIKPSRKFPNLQFLKKEMHIVGVFTVNKNRDDPHGNVYQSFNIVTPINRIYHMTSRLVVKSRHALILINL